MDLQMSRYLDTFPFGKACFFPSSLSSSSFLPSFLRCWISLADFFLFFLPPNRKPESYVVLRDVSALPETLSGILRQWMERVSEQ
jgi:hypothetical protein